MGLPSGRSSCSRPTSKECTAFLGCDAGASGGAGAHALTRPVLSCPVAERIKMPGPAGLRSGTRHMFTRGFRKHGFIPLTTYLRNYKVGDYVDIKVNAAVHKVRVVAAGVEASYSPDAAQRRRCWASPCRRVPRVLRGARAGPAARVHEPASAVSWLFSDCRACPTSGTRARRASSGT